MLSSAWNIYIYSNFLLFLSEFHCPLSDFADHLLTASSVWTPDFWRCNRFLSWRTYWIRNWARTAVRADLYIFGLDESALYLIMASIPWWLVWLLFKNYPADWKRYFLHLSAIYSIQNLTCAWLLFLLRTLNLSSFILAILVNCCCIGSIYSRLCGWSIYQVPYVACCSST